MTEGQNWARPSFFDLLPEIYRYLDAGEGHPLEALTSVLEDPFHEQEKALEELYGNWFVETCRLWVLPYLAGLVGIDWITDSRQIISSLRALVANTIRYRQSKGTPWTLERALSDASGWGVVLNIPTPADSDSGEAAPRAIHPGEMRAVNGIVHDSAPVDRATVDSATVDTAAVDTAAGDPTSRDSLKGSGLEGSGLERSGEIRLRRLQVFPMLQGHPGRAGALYTFAPDGRPMQLYNSPAPRPTFGKRLSRRCQPAPLSRAWLGELLARAVTAGKNGTGLPFAIYLDGEMVSPESYHLTTQERLIAGQVRDKISLDPERGVFALPAGKKPQKIRVDYAYAAAGRLGGGPYERTGSGGEWDHGALNPGDPHTRKQRSSQTIDLWEASVCSTFRGDGTNRFKSLEAALKAWRTVGSAGKITILDNGTYSLRPHPKPLILRHSLKLCTAPGKRPYVTGKLRLAPHDGESSFSCSGILWGGALQVLCRGSHIRFRLHLEDMTLIPKPGHPSLDLGQDEAASQVKGQGLPEAKIHLDRCITGALLFRTGVFRFCAYNSIIDGGTEKALTSVVPKSIFPLPSLVHCRTYKTTVFGGFDCRWLNPASETIFADGVEVIDTQNSRARYCYFPPGTAQPLSFRCTTHPEPLFASRRYGDPGFAQLRADCPETISRGGEGGSEIGVFNANNNPFRLINLGHVLREYTLAGFDPKLVFVD